MEFLQTKTLDYSRESLLQPPTYAGIYQRGPKKKQPYPFVVVFAVLGASRNLKKPRPHSFIAAPTMTAEDAGEDENGEDDQRPPEMIIITLCVIRQPFIKYTNNFNENCLMTFHIPPTR